MTTRRLFLWWTGCQIATKFVFNKVTSIRDKDASWMASELKQTTLDEAINYIHYIKWKYKVQNRQCYRIYSNLVFSLSDSGIETKKSWSILSHFQIQYKISCILLLQQSHSWMLQKGQNVKQLFSLTTTL